MTTNLSRRGFLGGLLSTAAVISSGPIARIVPPTEIEVYGRSPGMVALEDLKFLEGMSQKIVQTFIYGNPEWCPTQFTGFEMKYDH